MIGLIAGQSIKKFIFAKSTQAKIFQIKKFFTYIYIKNLDIRIGKEFGYNERARHEFLINIL